MTTLFEALRHDHDAHRKLMSALANTSGASEERSSLYETLKKELTSHAAAEERCLYAHMMQDPMSTPKARHSVAEHQDIDKYLAELDALDMSDPQWLKTFKDLRHRVEHHMEEEEQEVFQVAGKVIAPARKTSLAERFIDEKQREMERL